MSIVESLFGAAKGLVTAIAESKLPVEIVEIYPETSQAVGARAGSYLLKRTEKGFEYSLVRPPAFESEAAQAELVLGHIFNHLGSLSGFLDQTIIVHDGEDAAAKAHAFLRFDDGYLKAQCTCLPCPEHPEIGQLDLAIERHPAWHRWARVGPGFAEGAHVDLSHIQIADLLLDNAEDLDEPMIAQHLATMRAARQVEYDANLSGGGSMGVKTSFGLDKATETRIPREFVARFPCFTGAWWPTGDELADVDQGSADPSFMARFRLRVMPPKGDGSSGPVFRLIWTNARDYEHEARRALAARFRDVLAGKAEVYLGSPSVQRYILPLKRAAR